jgi:hypothetical protein
MVMATASANTMRILHVIRGTVKRFAIIITLAARANELSCLSRELMANQAGHQAEMLLRRPFPQTKAKVQ